MQLPIGDAATDIAPIGLFDSGVGGLSVFLHLAKALPQEHYLYFADTLNVPYGSRSSAEIFQLTLNAVEWLYHRGCKLIVIACNSASAHALDAARLRYPTLPIVGLVPALKPAVLASQTKHVAVLATKATLEGKLLNQVITEVAAPSGTAVTKHFDPHLVPWVESGMPRHHQTAIRLINSLHEFHQGGVDHLVLGCTHYPFFKPLLEAEIEQQQLPIRVLDSGAAIAARVQYLLNSVSPAILTSPLSTNLQSDLALTMPVLRFYATAYQPSLGDLVRGLVGQPVELLNEQ